MKSLARVRKRGLRSQEFYGGLPTVWIASVNMTALGEYLERLEAMRRVEERIEASMQFALNDWELYLAAKAKRAG
jgi:hypothetical protein